MSTELCISCNYCREHCHCGTGWGLCSKCVDEKFESELAKITREREKDKNATND